MVTECTRFGRAPHDELTDGLPAEWGAVRSSLAGFPIGARAHYRGPAGLHLSDMGDSWVWHHDRADPREDPVGHLLLDLPTLPIVAVFLMGAVLVAVLAHDG